MQPRVVVISAGAAERETIGVVARTMGFQCIIAPNLDAAISIGDSESVSAALLDLPTPIAELDRVHRDLRALLVRYLGRVILLTDERSDPQIREWIRKYCIPSLQRDRLAVDLWLRLESMVYPQFGIGRLAHLARLVFDTSVHPLPRGFRSIGPRSRQLVYETANMSADIMIERPAGSAETKLIGQILRTTEPVAPLDDIPVVLKSPAGPLAFTLTNNLGEFSFEFRNERSLTLEIEAYPNEVVVITPPTLE